MSDNTHFGFETVPEDEKARKVGEVFHSVASRYDLMNDAMSVGMHRLWKRYTVETSGVRAGQKVLDIAGGSGDLSRLFAKKVGPGGEVVLTDINASMLAVGRDRLLDDGLAVPALQCDAEKLPFPSNYFDCVIVAFGLRNMTHKELALKEMQRVLKPGGNCWYWNSPKCGNLWNRYTMPIHSNYCRGWARFWLKMRPATVTWLNRYACILTRTPSRK